MRYAIVQDEPYQYFYAQNVFPWDYYRAILKNLPYDATVYSDKSYQNRMMADTTKIGTLFWDELSSWMLSQEFCTAVCNKFGKTLRDRRIEEVAPNMRLVRDSEQYSIKVHTDIPPKAISLLFYLPRDSSMVNFGTSIYTSKSPGFKGDGYKRWEFEDFNKVASAPFLPNSVLGFARSDISWHGVEPQGRHVRNVLLYNVYAETKGEPQKEHEE